MTTSPRASAGSTCADGAGPQGDQRLGQRIHGVMQHQGAQLFGQRRAAGSRVSVTTRP
jgi:hypothetical protein